MDLREQKGKWITQTRVIKKLDDGFAVQSQNSKRFFTYEELKKQGYGLRGYNVFSLMRIGKGRDKLPVKFPNTIPVQLLPSDAPEMQELNARPPPEMRGNTRYYYFDDRRSGIDKRKNK
ncbi:MAG: hypothetical protein PHD95_06155 [Candidatus ainarchaeum sp.]|nr:hypothetical protein [Candidatus ainarchaeum sp.]